MKYITFLVLLLVSLGAHSEIKTKEQADKFIEEYCIVLVDELQKSVTLLNEYREAGEWKKHRDMAAWIGGVAGVYNNLCK